MLTLASHTETGRPTAPDYSIQAAHFDVALAAAGAGPAELVSQGLSSSSGSTMLLNCADCEAGRPSKAYRGKAMNLDIALTSGSRETGFGTRDPDAIFYTAMKLLCFDDQLFNRRGGYDFVRMSASAARRAGRMTALLCTDARTAFTKRDEIVGSFGGVFDIVAGEPAAVLALFGVNRIDTLVPKLARSGTGLVLHRVDFPPICLRPRSADVDVGKAPISPTSFWSEFVPAAFGDLVKPRLRAA
ncbi:MAG: hypothetical protein JJ913_01875 [Rhizobiaceae bacterium]|nr:hypothetical protein [Rhizobiaceae bacterium]